MSTKTGQVLVSSTSSSAGATTRGRLDASAAEGGIIVWRVTNGATGPTTQAEVRILIARKQTSMPSAAAEGTADDDWKRVFTQGCGTASNGVTRGSYRFGPEVAYIEWELTGHTGQAVTGECTGTTYA